MTELCLKGPFIGRGDGRVEEVECELKAYKVKNAVLPDVIRVEDAIAFTNAVVADHSILSTQLRLNATPLYGGCKVTGYRFGGVTIAVHYGNLNSGGK